MRLLVTGGSGFIGTNLVEAIAEKVDLINIDVKNPKKGEHFRYWRKCDILDLEALQQIFQNFQPTHVVHLAARTDTRSQSLSDYVVNTNGTANLLKAIQRTSGVERVIITSTQYVFGPPGIPKHDEDFNPIGAYGQSKVISEQLTRSADLHCSWIIVRPTNIWGPWHPRYPYEFWRILARGLYFHPRGCNPIRAYGYVGNLVFQILQLLKAEREQVHGKVFYLGDAPIRLMEWVNGFSRAITGRDARIVPRKLIQLMAKIGDVLMGFGVNAPIHSSRFRSMCEDYGVPMEKTFELLGLPPYSLKYGITETVEWLKSQNFLR